MARDRRQWEGDVLYEVWRNGGNVDAVDRDDIRDGYERGESPEDEAAYWLRRSRRRDEDDDT